MEKDQKTDIDVMIMVVRYLNALGKEPRESKLLSEMEREDYIDKINSLTSVIEQFKESYSLLKGAMESSEKHNEALQSQVFRLLEIICGLTDDIRSLREEVSKQSDYTKRHNKMFYGKKSREEEKMDDGSGTPSCGSQDSSLDSTKVKPGSLDKNRVSRGPYTQMEAERVIRLKTTPDGCPAGMKFIGYKTIDEFNRISSILSVQVLKWLFMRKYGVRHDYCCPENPSDTRRPKANVISGTLCTLEFSPIIRRIYVCALISSLLARTAGPWLKIGVNLLMPLCEYFKQQLLKVKSVLHIDETWCRVRIKYKGERTKLGRYFKKYVWVLVNNLDGLVYFLYNNDENDSRGCRPIEEFLGVFNGSIQSDGCVVYKHFARSNPENVHLLCWAHVRSKFKYAEEISKDPDTAFFVEQIGLLYMVEAENIKLHLSAEEIKRRRSSPDITGILAAFHDRAER